MGQALRIPRVPRVDGQPCSLGGTSHEPCRDRRSLRHIRAPGSCGCGSKGRSPVRSGLSDPFDSRSQTATSESPSHRGPGREACSGHRPVGGDEVERTAVVASRTGRPRRADRARSRRRTDLIETRGADDEGQQRGSSAVAARRRPTKRLRCHRPIAGEARKRCRLVQPGASTSRACRWEIHDRCCRRVAEHHELAISFSVGRAGCGYGRVERVRPTRPHEACPQR